MLPAVLFTTALLASADIDCRSTADCNRLGTQALQAGAVDRASALFEIQIDFADTALHDDDDGHESTRRHAREIALNNAALAALRGGHCPLARAWLDVADASHAATRANRRQWTTRCGEPDTAITHTGEFRQYAGHGAWNTVTLRAGDDDTLHLDAFWMRLGRAPLREYGPAAFGTLDGIVLRRSGDTATGVFEGNDPGVECRLDVQFAAQRLTVTHTDDAACLTGGAGSQLGGAFVRVGDAVDPVDGDDDPHGQASDDNDAAGDSAP